MHFDLFDLRLFVFVAEASNLRRGAERACISLAAASTRIKQLETNIGSKLLYRKAHGVELNPAGQAFLQHARRILQQVEHLKCDLTDYAAGLKGHIRILANTTSINSALPMALASFLANQSGVNIDLRERLSQDIIADINEARADIGIVAGNVDTQGLASHPFATDKLVVVVPPGHRLAGVTQTSFLQTLDDPHISLPEDSALARFLPPLARALGHQLEFRIQVGSFESICLLVEAGVGIGVIPRSSAQRHARTMGLRIIGLTDPWATREMQIVHRTDIELPRLTSDLVQHLAGFAADNRLKPPVGH
ncbi:MAG: LysR family transcriptional regulator [Burkholderiaceae bacterium]